MEPVILYVALFGGFPEHGTFVDAVVAAAQAAAAERGVVCSEHRLTLSSLDGGADVEKVGREIPHGKVFGCYFFIPTSDARDDLGAYLLPVSAWQSMLDRCEAAGIVTLWPHSRRCWKAIEDRTYLLLLSACAAAKAWATPTSWVARSDYGTGAANAVTQALHRICPPEEAGHGIEEEEDERFVAKLGYGAYGGHVRVVDHVGDLLDAIDVLFAQGHEAEGCFLQRFVEHAVEARVWAWRQPGKSSFSAFADEWTMATLYIDPRRGGEDGRRVVPKKVPREAALASLCTNARRPADFEADLVKAAADAAEIVAGVLQPFARDAADTTSFRLDLLIPQDQPEAGVTFRLVEVTPAHGDVEHLEEYHQVLMAKWRAAFEATLGPIHPRVSGPSEE